jgi:RNA polymerase sigma factor (sigma-70 family)
MATTLAGNRFDGYQQGKEDRLTARSGHSDADLPVPHAGDAALVEACLAGQRGSWETLVRTYAPLVYTIARRSGLSQDEAEDVSQIVFASLLQSLGTLRDGQSVSKWLIVVAKRHSWKVLRARPALADADVFDAAGPAAAEATDEAWQRRQALQQGLAALGGRCQELLTALFSDRNQPDYAQVSERLGIPIGSIGPTRNRCLRKLMELLMEAPGAAALWDPADHAPGTTRPPGRV